MGNYDQPLVITHLGDFVDFGAGDATRHIKGPKGKYGRVVDIILPVVETFTNTTTAGAVQVGVSGTLDKFADLPTGTQAADTCLVASAVTGAIVDGQFIEPDQDVIVTCLAPTGGTPAGQGYPQVVIAWF